MATSASPGFSCVTAFKTTMLSYMAMMGVEQPVNAAQEVVRNAVRRIFDGMPLMIVWSDDPTPYRCTLRYSDAYGYHLQSRSFSDPAEVVLFDPVLDEWHIPNKWFHPPN